MHALILASLGLNVLVLVPVCLGLLLRSRWVEAAYGLETPARGILLSVYLAILFASAGLLVMPVPAMVAGLLILQIVYKVSTPFTVRSFSNPVVVSNLAIAAVHIVTLVSIREAALP